MASGLSPWRALRPVLLAGAATLTWLTLSSTAATADSADAGALLGGVTSSVSSLATPLASTLPDAAPMHHQAAPSSGLLQPVVGTLADTTDQLITAVPIVNDVVPAGTVSAVAVPVAVVADEAAAGLVETVAPPLVEAVPILEPVVQPVSDLVTGTVPLPDPLPSVPDSGSVTSDSAGIPNEGDSLADPGTAGNPTGINLEEPFGAGSTGSAGFLASPVAALAETSSSLGAPTTAATEPALPLAGGPPPAPSVPSSGAGSGASPSGSSGSAAWLNDLDIELQFPGSFPVSGSSEHAPSPVSFDPGSSPD